MGLWIIIEPFKRVLGVLRTEGLYPLLKKTFQFIREQVFNTGTYYLYEHRLRPLEEKDYFPDIKNVHCEIITSNLEADQLEETGLEWRSQFLYSRAKLDRGGIAVCIFVDKKIACLSWIAINKKAERSFVHRRYSVNYAGGECSTGGAYTLPQYRGKGLMTYSKFKQFQYLYNRGFKTVRCAVEKDYPVQQRVNAKFSPVVYAEVRFVKILCLIFKQELTGSQ